MEVGQKCRLPDRDREVSPAHFPTCQTRYGVLAFREQLSSTCVLINSVIVLYLLRLMVLKFSEFSACLQKPRVRNKVCGIGGQQCCGHPAPVPMASKLKLP